MAELATVKKLEKAALLTKLDLFRLAKKESIHIGGDLSCCEIMTAIWTYAMHYDTNNPRWEGRDRFILSKGHAAAVTTFSQVRIGCYSADEVIDEYATDFGRFSMHSCNLRNPYVDVSTGSLGMGLQVASGIAAGLRLKGNNTSRIFTVMGDGECGEGSVYEAARFAANRKLGNIVAFIDCNGMTFDGFTEELAPLGDLRKIFEDFGWNALELEDGHDMNAIADIIDSLPAADSDKPTIVVCHTVKGHGVSFMERAVKWHAGSLSEEDYEKCVDEVKKAYIEKWGEE